MNKLDWLGKREEIEFKSQKFRGKNSGKLYRYSNSIDGLIRSRAIILLLPLYLFLPIIFVLLDIGSVDMYLLYERVFFAILILLSGLMFNKIRIISIIIPSLILSLIIYTKLELGVSAVIYDVALLLFILSAFYFNFKTTKLRKELRESLNTN